MARAILAVFAVATTLLAAQDGPALVFVHELINSLRNRKNVH